MGIIAAMAQLVEHILGKDEVPGPNPGSSSRHPRCNLASGLWLFIGLFDSQYEIINISGFKI